MKPSKTVIPTSIYFLNALFANEVSFPAKVVTQRLPVPGSEDGAHDMYRLWNSAASVCM